MQQPGARARESTGEDDLGRFAVFGPRRPRETRLVRLLEVEPRIAGDLSGDALVLARNRLRAPAFEVTWEVIEPARFVIVDARFVVAARAWPQLVAGLVDAVFSAAVEQRELTAAAKLPRIEDRLFTYMSRLADRWGTVRPDGLVGTLPVTHEVLGRLVGARRPTVSLALAALAQQSLLRRLGRSRWWMPARAVATAARHPALEAGANLEPTGTTG